MALLLLFWGYFVPVCLFSKNGSWIGLSVSFGLLNFNQSDKTQLRADCQSFVSYEQELTLLFVLQPLLLN